MSRSQRKGYNTREEKRKQKIIIIFLIATYYTGETLKRRILFLAAHQEKCSIFLLSLSSFSFLFCIWVDFFDSVDMCHHLWTLLIKSLFINVATFFLQHTSEIPITCLFFMLPDLMSSQNGTLVPSQFCFHFCHLHPSLSPPFH